MNLLVMPPHFTGEETKTWGSRVHLDRRECGVGDPTSSSGSHHYRYDPGQVTYSLNLTLLNCKMDVLDRIMNLLFT